MSPRRNPLLLVVVSCLIARGLPATASGPPAAAGGGAPAATLRLVTWYDRRRPFDTFRYRVYDLGRGDYTRAVDDWKALMGRSYPGYAVSTRDLDVRGVDPARAVAAAVEEEKDNLARAILINFGIGRSARVSGYSRGYGGLGPSPRSPFKNPIPREFPPLGDPHFFPNSPSYLFPVPFPYPRPHP